MEVKNIIFDLGGVLLNINYQKTIEAFKALGIPAFEELFEQARQTSLFDDIETGSVEPDVFYKSIKAIIDKEVSKKAIRMAWNAMLLDLPEERYALLKSLKQHFNIYLLSNTNVIHYDEYRAYLTANYGYYPLEKVFIKEYYSHQIGKRKPHIETFEWVVRDAGIIASETLFIDDTIQHVIGARKAGLHAYHLTNGQTVTEILCPEKLKNFLTQFD